jgi:MFS family permease
MRLRQTSRRRAMANYYRFSIFNVISFTFLAGNIIVLYSLRLGAGTVLVGLIAASYQVPFLFSLIGRRLIGRVGAVKLFGSFWFLRALLMLPVVLTALPVIREHTGLVLAIVSVCAFGFNIAKGVGITGTKPIVGEIPPQRERGAFLSNHHLIIHTGAIVAGLATAVLLGQDAPIWRYALLLSIGTFAGFTASYFILRLPEPRQAGAGFSIGFSKGLRTAFAPGPFRRLNAMNFIVMFGVSMVNAFLIVYLKRVYGYADGSVVYFTAAGSAGGAVMALLSRAVVDRVGAKPLLFAFVVLLVAVLVPVIVAPDVAGVWVWLFPALIYFFFVMGQFGVINAADNYFFSITEAEDRLNLGVIFGLGSGIAGAAGSFLGGLLLSALQRLSPESLSFPFSLYFAAAALVMLTAVFFTVALPDLAAYRITDALGMLFSPRDLRAIRLLNRLRRSRTVDEEYAAVRALRESTSRLAVDDLLEKMKSPALTIRMEAISALRDSPLTGEVEDLLISQVRNQLFTTAHLAAELLGNGGVRRAVPALREALASNDYMACAKAAVALAQIGDRESIPSFEALLDHSPNPRVTVYAAKALEILGSVRSLPRIFRRIERRAETFVRDELILSSSRLLGFFDWFYPLYREFLEDAEEGMRSMTDLAENLPEDIRNVLVVLRADPRRFGRLAISYLRSHKLVHDSIDVGSCLIDALSNRQVGQLERFRFLVAATLVRYAGVQAAGE